MVRFVLNAINSNDVKDTTRFETTHPARELAEKKFARFSSVALSSTTWPGVDNKRF